MVGQHSALPSQEGFYFQLNLILKPLLRVFASSPDLNSLPIRCGKSSIIKEKLPSHIALSYHGAAGSVGVTAKIRLSQVRDYSWGSSRFPCTTFWWISTWGIQKMFCSKREASCVVSISLCPLQTSLWQWGFMHCALIGSSQQRETIRWGGSTPQLMTANILPERDLNLRGSKAMWHLLWHPPPPPNTLQTKKLDPICQLPFTALTTSQVSYSISPPWRWWGGAASLAVWGGRAYCALPGGVYDTSENLFAAGPL